MTEVAALSVPAAGAPFENTTIDRRSLRDDDVSIEIAFCGICHTDIHQVKNEWGMGMYPMVPGHEIAGTVTAVGGGVTRFAVGDRVGVGCFVDSCGTCAQCAAGDEQYCSEGAVQTYSALDHDGETTYGGYSRQIVVKEPFVVRIPDSIELQDAAPLLCAGITTYSPLRYWNVGPDSKVAVIGFGGLGHVAVKLAAAMGAEVTVLSRTLAKREDGLRFGATDYRATSDPSTFADLAGSFDFILNTVSAPLDLDAFLSLLRVNGTLVNVGAPPTPASLSVFSLIMGRRAFAGSLVGGLAATQEMLDFCAEHGVVPEIELIAADEVGAAYERVLESDVRYRFVIDAATIGESVV